LKAYRGIILQLEVNKMVQEIIFNKKNQTFFTGAIDHAHSIFLRAFSGTGAIAPVS
jgi:hypothetical protein